MDVDARREARRRKILENGANRIKKITGVESKSLINVTNVSPIEDDRPAETVVREVELASESVLEIPARKPQNTDSFFKQFICLRLMFLIVLGIVVSFDTFWPFKSVFMPILTFKLIEFTTIPSRLRPRSDKKFLILIFSLISVKAHSSVSRNLLDLLDQIASVMQDVFVYFFVFISVNLVKSLVIG